MFRIENSDVFYGESQALRNVSLEAEIGKITCVMGRNGVGKTTLMKTVNGHLHPKRGKVLWQDQDISKLNASERARRLGIATVPQGRDIFPLMTVKENLETGLGVLPRTKRKIDPMVYELFPVLKDMLGRRGGDLSGGQQQQLAIARALLMKPKLLVLDEPTEGIQPSVIKDIQRVIWHLAEEGNMAIVLVEQYLDFAIALADTITVLDHGQIVMSGKASEMDENVLKQHVAI